MLLDLVDAKIYKLFLIEKFHFREFRKLIIFKKMHS